MDDILILGLLGMGCFFFTAGTMGLLVFPDICSRLHALTKADNLGLGFVAMAVSIESGSFFFTLKAFGVWLLVVIASCFASYLIANLSWQEISQASQEKQEES